MTTRHSDILWDSEVQVTRLWADLSAEQEKHIRQMEGVLAATATWRSPEARFTLPITITVDPRYEIDEVRAAILRYLEVPE